MVKIGGNNGSLFNQAYSFQYVWSNLGYWASLFVVFISVLTIIITSNEHSFRTNRQNIIDGLTRLEFYHSKWLFVMALSVFTTLYVFIIGFFFGLSGDEISNFPGEITPLFYVFILTLNYSAFGLLLALLLKRSGISIGIFFLYAMFIESLFKGIINWITNTETGNFLPLQASDELLPFPLAEIVKTVAGVTVSISDIYYVIASLIWILIYYLIGRYRILKSDW